MIAASPDACSSRPAGGPTVLPHVRSVDAGYKCPLYQRMAAHAPFLRSGAGRRHRSRREPDVVLP